MATRMHFQGRQRQLVTAIGQEKAPTHCLAKAARTADVNTRDGQGSTRMSTTWSPWRSVGRRGPRRLRIPRQDLRHPNRTRWKLKLKHWDPVIATHC